MHVLGHAPKWHCYPPALAPRPAHTTHMPRRRDIDADAGGWGVAFYSLQRKRGWFDGHAARVSATKIATNNDSNCCSMLSKRF